MPLAREFVRGGLTEICYVVYYVLATYHNTRIERALSMSSADADSKWSLPSPSSPTSTKTQSKPETDNNPAHFDCLLWGCPPSKWTILRENLGFTIKFKFTVQPQAQIAANQLILKSLFEILKGFILGTNGCASRGGAQGSCHVGSVHPAR